MHYYVGAILLFMNMIRHSSALVCTCGDIPGSRPPYCDFDGTCTVDDEIGLCTTGHNYLESDPGSSILIVESACISKELNPNWRDYCSGRNSVLIRCCEMDNCNREWHVYEYPTPEELSRYVPPTDGSSTVDPIPVTDNGTLTSTVDPMPATETSTAVNPMPATETSTTETSTAAVDPMPVAENGTLTNNGTLLETVPVGGSSGTTAPVTCGAVGRNDGIEKIVVMISSLLLVGVARLLMDRPTALSQKIHY